MITQLSQLITHILVKEGHLSTESQDFFVAALKIPWKYSVVLLLLVFFFFVVVVFVCLFLFFFSLLTKE